MRLERTNCCIPARPPLYKPVGHCSAAVRLISRMVNSSVSTGMCSAWSQCLARYGAPDAMTVPMTSAMSQYKTSRVLMRSGILTCSDSMATMRESSRVSVTLRPKSNIEKTIMSVANKPMTPSP